MSLLTGHVVKSFSGYYRFLSNFYITPVVFEGVQYRSSEHAYQASKSLDPQVKRHITRLLSPIHVRAYGRTLQCRDDWKYVRVEMMRRVLAAKFAENSGLATYLVNTGDAELIEGNTWGDQFWGTVNGEGENWLGRLLMERRSQLAK